MSTTSSSGKKSPKRQPPAHLSEFYSYVNGNSNNINNNTTKTMDTTNGTDGINTSHHQYDSYGIHSSPLTRSKTGSSTNSSSYLPSHNKTESYDGSSSFFDPTKKYGTYSTREDSVHSGFSSISPSTLDLEVLITKKDVEETINSYHDLIKTAQAYRAALVTLSNAASEFGRSLENCARFR
ncbi:unnamed protein product [Ambrosiozyma monospora]|uniref:Unnamed protein product n=1 Tax=Ambrosiozyma monospora TaxID=43982 RepID=A0ACB5UDD7_AMBMO|nr:unnamed protein product [Ambrosiozyma monospora]